MTAIPSQPEVPGSLPPGRPAATIADPATRHSTPAVLVRADLALVNVGLARSRTHAAKLIAAGRVQHADVVVDRPSRPVAAADLVVVGAEGDLAAADETDWVSRGAVKLDRALTALGDVPVAGLRCLDAGAATGGFTEVLLRRGAREVIAVDVGREQLAPSLRVDARVHSLEGTSVRDLQPAAVGGAVDLLVADLSFISLPKVLADLSALTGAAGQQVLMVKPQFEVGRARLPRGGVVRETGDRVVAVLGVAAAARALGWIVAGATTSVLPGPAGNVEFFLWLKRPTADPSAALDDAALAAIVRAGR